VAEFNEPRFRYFHNGTNLGMMPSFNKSIERSRGQFVVVITDDDPVYPDMVQTLYDLHRKHPGYGVYSGGHDTIFTGSLQAGMAKARVGTNSGLANWDLGAEKVFSPSEFAHAFLDGTIGGSMLWSVGLIRRDIALSVGGIPVFGTPHLADVCYLLLCGTKEGCVYINTALGCRTIHDDNYSYREANYESIYAAPEAFYRWALEHLPAELNTPQLQNVLARSIGRDLTVVVISIKKMLQIQGVKSPAFETFRRRFFHLPLLRKWKRKYYIAVYFPNAFELFLVARKMFFRTPIKQAGQ
jgi:GT2 family glycosyltransferase